jgi:hypothetical protein
VVKLIRITALNGENYSLSFAIYESPKLIDIPVKIVDQNAALLL